MESKPGQPSPKKSNIKNWESPAKRTAKSDKKLHDGIDALKPYVEGLVGRKVHRTDVPYLVRQLLDASKGGTNSKASLYAITNLLCQVGLKYEIGQEVDLEAIWKYFLKGVSGFDSTLAQRFDNDEHRMAFIWQIGGHFGNDHSPIPKVFLHTGRSLSSDGVWGYAIDGKFIPHSIDQLPVPTFLCPGAMWDKKGVLGYTLKNISFSHDLLEELLKLAFGLAIPIKIVKRGRLK